MALLEAGVLRPAGEQAPRAEAWVAPPALERRAGRPGGFLPVEEVETEDDEFLRDRLADLVHERQAQRRELERQAVEAERAIRGSSEPPSPILFPPPPTGPPPPLHGQETPPLRQRSPPVLYSTAGAGQRGGRREPERPWAAEREWRGEDTRRVEVERARDWGREEERRGARRESSRQEAATSSSATGWGHYASAGVRSPREERGEETGGRRPVARRQGEEQRQPGLPLPEDATGFGRNPYQPTPPG